MSGRKTRRKSQKAPSTAVARKRTMEKPESPNVAELVSIAVRAALEAAGVGQNTQYTAAQRQIPEPKPRRRAKQAPGKVIEPPPSKEPDWNRGHKTCPKCGQDKLLREFGPRPRRGRMYVQSYCTKCRGLDYSKRPRKYRVK